VWLATADQPSFPPLDGDLDVDVAVVGGGITGLTTALLLQRDGARVALVEARRVGGGTTGHTTGKVTSQHGLTYASLLERHGEDRARQYAQANQQAVATVADLAASLDVDCGFEPAAAFVYTRTGEARADIEAEHAAALRLGLPATLTADVDLPFPVDLALRFDDQGHMHPARYTAALARALAAGGARVVEGTRALDVDEDGDAAVVRTVTGDVRATTVVVATLLPFVDAGGFFAKARPTRAYGIAVRLRGEAPSGMHIPAEAPVRSTRPWDDDGRPGLVVVGESHPTGEEDPTPGRWGALERWAREHFDVEAVAYRWSSQDYTTVDELPYVGRSPRLDRTVVATGFRKWGRTNGTAAATILADLVAGRTNAAAEAFDATRIGDLAAVKELVGDNLHVARRLVADRVARLRADDLATLEPGTGAMVDVDGDAVGAYRAPDGRVEAVSITCTHLGCTLRFNAAETSWDCPCHGSRFATDGAVLDGPAVRPLDRIEVDDQRG